MSLVLESKKSDPIRVSTAIWLRRLTWIVVAAGALAVLLASVLVKVTEIGSEGSTILWVTAKSLAHLSYLYLIFWLLVFREPPDRLYKQKLLFPVVLLVGYLLYFSAAYAGYANTFGQQIPFYYGNRIQLQDVLQTLTQSVFLLLYTLWLIRDLQELKENRNRRRQGEIFFWVLVESGACALLLIRVLHEFGVVKLSNNQVFLFEKDTAIFACLALFVLIGTFHKLFESGWYRSIYENYLRHNNPVTIHPPSCELLKVEAGSSLLDFGCGNGARLKEIAAWGLFSDKIDNESVNVFGFDRDESWGPAYKDTFGKRNVKFVTNLSEVELGNIRLVCFSHVLYDKKSVHDAIGLLKKCKDGTVVLIRGASPDSFFTLTSMVFSLRLLTPTYSHCWYKDHLSHIERSASLKRLDAGKIGGDTDGEVSQSYKLNGDSILHAKELLSFLYGQTAGESAARYFSELVARGNRTEVPNNDIIYLFKISREPRA